MRNVPFDDPVLGGSQSEWLHNKVIGMKRHPFVLVSENAVAPGWVTEKIYQALAAGVVPVWIGPKPYPQRWEENYLLPFVPPDSVVLASSFPQLRDLATFLEHAATNATVYNRFHKWRKPIMFNRSQAILRRALGMSFEETPCRICQALHAGANTVLQQEQEQEQD